MLTEPQGIQYPVGGDGHNHLLGRVVLIGRDKPYRSWEKVSCMLACSVASSSFQSSNRKGSIGEGERKAAAELVAHECPFASLCKGRVGR